MSKIILDLCGGTGSWSKPYKDNGYDVRVITLPDYDVCTYEPPGNVYGILAAPPCQMFSIARQRAKTPRCFQTGMRTVIAVLNIVWKCFYTGSLQFWALENPATGYLKRFLGKPAMVFNPYEFGDWHTKSTALWGHFNQPMKLPKHMIEFGYETTVKGKRNYVNNVEDFHVDLPIEYLMKTGFTRKAVARSITPPMFARAFYEANR